MKIMLKSSITRFVRQCMSSKIVSEHDMASQKVLERWKRQYETIGRIGREVVFVLGPMGVGKSTIIGNVLQKEARFRDYLYVDCDEIMSSIDGFSLSEIDRFYKVSRQICFSLTDWICEKGFCFIAEGTCVDYLSLWRYMERLKESNYKIFTVFLSEPAEVVVHRAAQRERRLPDCQVKNIYESSIQGCQKIQELNLKKSIFKILVFPR